MICGPYYYTIDTRGYHPAVDCRKHSDGKVISSFVSLSGHYRWCQGTWSMHVPQPYTRLAIRLLRIPFTEYL